MAISSGFRIAFETKKHDAEGVGVTIIITLYNYEQYIETALDSVLKQSYPNIELVVVDDCSKDASLAAAHKWLQQNGDRFTQARLLSHLSNSGLAQARNTAFENAENDYVFVLDADNEIYPDAISKLLAVCISEKAEAAYSRLEKFGEATGLGGDVWDPARLARGNYIDAMALIKKSAWQEVGGYTKMKIPGWEDYDLWCKFVEHGFHGTFVPELLCRYRVHKSSMLQATTNPNLESVKSEMAERHPWLQLDAPPILRERLGYWWWRLKKVLKADV
jgi:glycosyltransferase involved in cell wall biosynthesis